MATRKVERTQRPEGNTFGSPATVERQSSRHNLSGIVPLDKNSFEPLYYQIQRQLKEQIRSGHLAVGDALPGEAEISRIFGVSRMTSRQALQALTAEGFSFRERGRGTFVRAKRVEKNIAHLLGFSAEMRALGLRATTQVLAKEMVAPAPEIAERLLIRSGEQVLMLRRLRLANDEPVAIEQIWLPSTRFPGIETIDFSKHSLYDTLQERYGVRIGAADEIIEARVATKAEAALLRIPAHSSLLFLSRTLLDLHGNPIEAGQSFYRGDRYRAVLHISGRNGTQS